jgi:hypothetical protein
MSIPFSDVELRWRSLPAGLHYPSTPAFALVGFREGDGPAGAFSVYVKRELVVNEAHVPQMAKLYALVSEMRGRLPEIGSRFYLTTGTTIVADCVTLNRGEEDSQGHHKA